MNLIGTKAIVVGASSGMGRELVREIADGGGLVVAIARRGDRLQELADVHPGRIFPIVHDVTNYEKAPELFQQATDLLTGLNLFIYASGVMPQVGGSEYSFAKDQAMIDVNITGAVAWLNLAAERMGNTGYGSIVALGSAAGERGRAGQPVYNASKAFIHSYMESIRNRIARKGVRVVTIKPGPVNTEMTANLKQRGAMDPRRAALKILALRNRTGEHFLKPTHALAFLIIRNIPSPIFRRLNI